MAGDKEHCFSVGMDDFLSKPIKLNDLKLILNKWLNSQIDKQ
jgi:CheY-like chemotaxis protein